MLRLTLALCAVAQSVSGEAQQEGLLTEESAKKMKISELKRYIVDRGATCNGCSEKSEFVAAALAARNNPTVTPVPLAREPPIKPDASAENINIDEIMKRINGDGKKKERVKKILKKRGYDPSLVDTMSFGSGSSMTDEQMADFLIKIADATKNYKGGKGGSGSSSGGRGGAGGSKTQVHAQQVEEEEAEVVDGDEL